MVLLNENEIIFFVGGLCTHSEYFENIQNGLKHVTTKVITIPNKINTEKNTFEDYCQYISKIIRHECDKTGWHTVTIVSFSMSCLISLQVATDLERQYSEIKFSSVLVNPANIFNEVWCDVTNLFDAKNHNAPLMKSGINTSKHVTKLNNINIYLKTLFLIMKWIPLGSNIILYLYYMLYGYKLNEPWCLLKYIVNEKYDDILNVIRETMIKSSWTDIIKKRWVDDAYLSRVKIISGRDDRYNAFARLLTTEYNYKFVLKEIEGQHHILYYNYDDIIDMMIT